MSQAGMHNGDTMQVLNWVSPPKIATRCRRRRPGQAQPPSRLRRQQQPQHQQQQQQQQHRRTGIFSSSTSSSSSSLVRNDYFLRGLFRLFRDTGGSLNSFYQMAAPLSAAGNAERRLNASFAVWSNATIGTCEKNLHGASESRARAKSETRALVVQPMDGWSTDFEVRKLPNCFQKLPK